MLIDYFYHFVDNSWTCKSVQCVALVTLTQFKKRGVCLIHDCLLQKTIMQSRVWDALFSVSAQNRVSTHSSLTVGWYVPANFFWVKCEGFLSHHDCQVSENNLKISDNFPNTSGRCTKFFRRCSNFFSTLPQLQYGAHVLSLKLKCNLKHNSFSMLWYTWDTKSTLCAFLEYFRDMELNLFYWSCVREKNRLEVWVRHKKLSLMRENDVFSPQACDSGIMRESWHV